MFFAVDSTPGSARVCRLKLLTTKTITMSNNRSGTDSADGNHEIALEEQLYRRISRYRLFSVLKIRR